MKERRKSDINASERKKKKKKEKKNVRKEKGRSG